MANLNIIQGNLTNQEYKEYIGQIIIKYYVPGDTITLSRNMKDAAKHVLTTIKKM